MMRSFIVTLKKKRIFLFELLIQMSTLCLYFGSTDGSNGPTRNENDSQDWARRSSDLRSKNVNLKDFHDQ